MKERCRILRMPWQHLEICDTGLWGELAWVLPLFAGRIDPVEYVGVSQQRNGNVRNRNHPLCGCATLVIQKTPFHYNRGVQATI